MAHRVRYALTGELPDQMTGVVEADEIYIGGKPRKHVPQTVKPGVRPQDNQSCMIVKRLWFPWSNVVVTSTLATLSV